MTAEYAASVDRWVEEIRAACGIPPAMVGRVGTPQVEAPQRSPGETLDQLDAAVNGRCAAPNCGQVLTEQSVSAYWCSPTCQAIWQLQQAGRPSPGSAPVRGSEGVDPSHMRWRPDLVTAFDDSGLELVEEITDCGLTRRWYHHRERGRFLRLDDGHRFVGAWAPEDGPADELWCRLERELTDQRRLDPEPPPDDPIAAMFRRHRAAVEAWEAEHRPPAGRPAAGAVFWLPDRPADPDAPTAAELAGGVQLGIPTSIFAQDAAAIRAAERVRLALAAPRFQAEGQPARPGPRDQHRLPAWLRRIESWLFPLTYCPGHGRRICAQCRWPDVRGVAAAHRGHRSRRLWVNLHVDARRFEEGMAQASEAFRRVGEQMSGAVGLGPVVAGPFAETYRRCIAEAVQTESAGLALRAVCTDGAMYRRALEAARERGWSARQMAAPVAAGRYTEDGWIELEYADGQRLESHVCQWEVSLETGCYRCGLHWSDGTRCESRTVDLTVTTRTERLVGPPATGDGP